MNSELMIGYCTLARVLPSEARAGRENGTDSVNLLFGGSMDGEVGPPGRNIPLWSWVGGEGDLSIKIYH